MVHRRHVGRDGHDVHHREGGHRRRPSPVPAPPVGKGGCPSERHAGKSATATRALHAKRASGPASSLRPSPQDARSRRYHERVQEALLLPGRASSASTSIPATSPPPRSPSTARCRSSAAPSPPLRPGILRDGEVADVPALAEALKALLRRARASPRACGSASPTSASSCARSTCRRWRTRRRSPPPSRSQAPDHIPMPMDEAVLDWQSLGIVTTPPARPRTRVVVVAVRREMVERLVGRRPRGRADGRGHRPVRLRHGPRARPTARPRAPCSTSASPASPTSPSPTPSGCLFTRAAAGGLDAMVHTLAERRGLTAEHARQWLAHVGLHAPLEERRGRRRARGRRARGARGGRPPARRHGPQLAELLPHAGERRAGRAAASSRAPPSPSPASSRRSPSSCACRSSPPSSVAARAPSSAA